MLLGGNLVGNPLKYEGGTVINWGIDPDVVSHGDLCKMVEEAGYRDVKALYYLKSGCSLSDGLLLCWYNKSFCDLIGYWLVEGEIHIYVEHDVSVPEISEAPLSLPAASIETDEGYNRNNTVDDGKDVSESHVVDEGLSNINNGVGPSEVNSDERVEANINEVGEGLSPTIERENVLWLSDNDDEELQEICNHYRSFRVNEEHSRGHEEQIPPTAKDLKDLLQKPKIRSDSTKNQEKGEGSGSGSETDYLDSSDLGSYGSDDDGEVVCKKSKKDYFDPSDKVSSFQLGMIFENSKQFKATLTKYTIAKRFDFKLSKNDRDKTRVVCKGKDCPWMIYASIDSRDEHYKVKTFIDQHTCSITFKNSRASYKVVAEHFLPKLRIIPDLKLHEMIKLGKEELKLDLTMGICRRARELAKEEINGNYKYEFKRLFDYVNALRRADTDGTIDLLVERPTPNHRPRFRRFYVYFSDMKMGFRECCRPFSNEGNTFESTPQAPVHSAVEDNVFNVPLTCSTSILDVPSSGTTGPTPPAPPVPTEEPPTPHCSTEPCIPPAPTSAATHHASTAHVPSNKKGKEKVLDQFSKPTTRERKIMEGIGVYVNFNTGLEILNNAPSSNQKTTSTTAPKKKAPCKKAGEASRKPRETNKERKNATRTTSKSSALYCDELRSYMLDLGRKISIDIVDDVPNTQESNTETKKQKKGKQNMTNSNKRN
ncbi:hypothetical protein V6N11_009304 [Hibiscus sabdariffa]|uniref:Transposase MuDR plant domain-containing protein n=1 Tax=Hibiscus sabdariffa TaxID=183260 RepID=A0ABR2PQ78_9ROSI